MKTSKMAYFLGKTTLVITFILLSMSCSEDDPQPCKELQQVCENLLTKANETQEPHEKARYQELYLLAKQKLQECRN